MYSGYRDGLDAFTIAILVLFFAPLFLIGLSLFASLIFVHRRCDAKSSSPGKTSYLFETLCIGLTVPAAWASYVITTDWVDGEIGVATVVWAIVIAIIPVYLLIDKVLAGGKERSGLKFRELLLFLPPAAALLSTHVLVRMDRERTLSYVPDVLVPKIENYRNEKGRYTQDLRFEIPSKYRPYIFYGASSPRGVNYHLCVKTNPGSRMLVYDRESKTFSERDLNYCHQHGMNEDQ